ncbi:hypothetical protein D3C72_1944410 [compost metagenome]
MNGAAETGVRMDASVVNVQPARDPIFNPANVGGWLIENDLHVRPRKRIDIQLERSAVIAARFDLWVGAQMQHVESPLSLAVQMRSINSHVAIGVGQRFVGLADEYLSLDFRVLVLQCGLRTSKKVYVSLVLLANDCFDAHDCFRVGLCI